MKTIRLYGATCIALEYARAYIHGICGSSVQIDWCDIRTTNLVSPRGGKEVVVQGTFFKQDALVSTAFNVAFILNRNEHGRWVSIHAEDYIGISGQSTYVARRQMDGCTEKLSFAKVSQDGGDPMTTRSIVTT